MTEVWALPGFDVQGLIGYGATGEVWRARELATGDDVALKRLREGADVAAVESLRREASVLRTLDTPYVVRLRAMLGEGADTVLVLDLAGGGSLASLLARRGSLDPGEVVTIAAPLAQALAAAHACGLVHGDVTPSNVLFTTEGMPLLADLGLARFAGTAVGGVDGTAEYVDPAVAAGGVPDAASDVWALAAVCHHVLSGAPPHDGESVGAVLDAARAGSRAPLGLLAPTAPRALVTAIEQGLQADPSLRPDASSFAAAVRRSHAAAPVRMTAGASAAGPSADPRPTHAVHAGPPSTPAETGTGRPQRRTLLLAAAATAALGVAVAVGWWSGGSGSGSVELASVATPAPTAGSPVAVAPQPGMDSPDWRAVLDALDAARAAAFAAADPRVLARVYDTRSPMRAADRSALMQLQAAGRTARGVRHTLRAVSPTSYDANRATLQVTDRLEPYVVVDGSARVVRRMPGRSDATFVVVLVRTARGWRLLQLTAI